MATATINTKPNGKVKRELARLTTIIDNPDVGPSPPPTVDEIWRRHEMMKGWWAARDGLIEAFQSMHDLESPFANDKEGREVGAYETQDGETIFATDTKPFEILSFIEAVAADRYPYIDAKQANPRQSEKQVTEFEQFAQAMLDERMKRRSLVQEGAHKLAVTGWLIIKHSYDPALAARSKFPYRIEVLDPIGVYPMLDSEGRAIWCSTEKYVSGAQLEREYTMYPGVAELFADEPEDADEKKQTREGDDLRTSRIKVIEYFDEYYRCILIDGEEVSRAAVGRNPRLKAIKEGRGKSVSSVFVGSAYDDDPCKGVLAHKLGCVPFAFAWGWAESRANSVLNSSAALGGRFVGLPFLFGQREHWQGLSRILSVLHQIQVDSARPKLITDSPNVDITGDVIQLEPGAKFQWEQPPAVPQPSVMLMQTLEGSVQRGTFSAAAYGQRAGNSGNQQADNYEAGTVRLNKLFDEVARAITQTVEGITCTMLERGDEPLTVVGLGEKYGGELYSQTYSVAGLKCAPWMNVSIKNKANARNPQMIAMAKSLEGFYPIEDIYRDLLEIPNPKAKLTRLRDEALQQEKTVLAPYVEIAAQKAKLEVMKEAGDLAWKLEKLEGDIKQQIAMRRIEEKLKDIPEEVLAKQGQDFLADIMRQVGLMPPVPPSGELPPPSQPGASAGMNTLTGAAPLPPPPMGMGMGANPMGGGGAGRLMSQLPPPPMGGLRPPLAPGTANAPGQAAQPLQPLSRYQPGGGVGRPGVDSLLLGPQNDTTGQPAELPAIAAANASVREPTMGATMPVVGLGAGRPTPSRPTRRGSRGKGGKK